MSGFGLSFRLCFLGGHYLIKRHGCGGGLGFVPTLGSNALRLDLGCVRHVVTLGNLLPNIDFLLALKTHYHKANHRLVELHAVLKNSR